MKKSEKRAGRSDESARAKPAASISAGRRGAIAARGLTVLLLAIGPSCDFVPGADEGVPTFLIRNDSRTPVELFEVKANGGERALGYVVRPGDVVYVDGIRGETGTCTDVPLIARDQAGRVIARKQPPLCRGETWSIARDDTQHLKSQEP